MSKIFLYRRNLFAWLIFYIDMGHKYKGSIERGLIQCDSQTIKFLLMTFHWSKSRISPSCLGNCTLLIKVVSKVQTNAQNQQQPGSLQTHVWLMCKPNEETQHPTMTGLTLIVLSHLVFLLLFHRGLLYTTQYACTLQYTLQHIYDLCALFLNISGSFLWVP